MLNSGLLILLWIVTEVTLAAVQILASSFISLDKVLLVFCVSKNSNSATSEGF